jgi:sodium/bile acid cotransporter 7
VLSFLRKRWFLLLMVAGGIVVWLRPWWLEVARDLDPRFIVAPSLFLTAWSLPSRSLYATLLRPWPALWATFLSYSLLPGLALFVGRMLPVADFGIGLLIICSVPCTLASAMIWTRMAGGNEATALLVILLTTCTSFLATTAWLSAATGATVPVNVGSMMTGLFLVLVIPVCAGQLLRVSPRFAQAATTHKILISVLARLLIFGILFKAALDLVDRLGAGERLHVGSLVLCAIACLGVHLAGVAVGFQSARLLRFSRSDAIAVGFSCSQKTLPVALLLFDAYFKDIYPLAVVPMVFYHVGQLVADTFVAEGMIGRKSEVPEP